jgi:glycosyl hydrolase family 42 (putative beta-galactosidase)
MAPPKYLMLAVTATCLTAAVALATPPYGDPNQPYDQIPGTWETDHTKWAKPLPHGKIKALFIVPYTTCREVVELAQRLDVDCTVLMTAGRATWARAGYEGANATPLHGVEAITVLEMLTRKRLSLANDYQAIVIGSVSWLALPPYARALILEHVARGAGLVYVSPNRIEKRIYNGLNLVSGGRLAATKDPQFTSLFQTNDDPEVGQRILAQLPVDSLPLKVLDRVDAFKKLKPLRARWMHDIRAQSPVCITATRHGKGRILGLHYFDAELFKQNRLTCLTPNVTYDPVTYDYAHALLAKCVLSSVGRLPSVQPRIAIHGPRTDLKAPTPHAWATYCWEPKTPATVIARRDLGKAKVIVSLSASAKAPARPVIVDYRLRRATGDDVVRQSISLRVQAGQTTSKSVALPPLARGAYFVSLRVLNQDRQVIAFASSSLRVEDPLRIQKLTTAKEAYQPGETIRGRVVFSRALAGHEQAALTAVDTWGRVVHRTVVNLAEARTEGTFSAPVHLPLCRLWDLVCKVSDKAGVVESATVSVGIPNWRFTEFVCAQWLGPIPYADYKGRCLTRSMRRFGQNAVTTQLLHGVLEQFEQAERCGVMNIFYAEHLGQRRAMKPFDATKEFSGACLSEFSRMARRLADTGTFPDPKEFPYKSGWMDARWFASRIEKRYRASARYGAPFYLIHGENHLVGESRGQGNSCFCPLCTRRFRTWCRKTYGDDIRKLNEEWGSRFKTFEPVRGILLKQAVDKNQLPRWVDFRYFMRSHVFTQFLIDWTDMIRRFAPQAKTADAVWDNCDYSRLRKHVTCGISGAGDMGAVKMELHQSFSGDASYILADGNTLRWDPEFRTPRDNVRYPWKYLFLGCSGLKIGMEQYDMLGGGSYVTADYSEPLPFFKRISNEVTLLQRGVGTLVLTAKPVRSKVAILWSPYNHYVSRLFPFQDNGFSGGSHQNVMAGGGAIEDCLLLMRSLRLRPTFIGPQDVEAGDLINKGYRALMLPYSKGVSLAEATAIKTFVAGGGVVIADNKPGACTQHGRVLKQGRLKELFPVLDRKHIQKYGKGLAAYLPGEINGYAARLARCDYTGSDSVATLLRSHADIRPPVQLLNSQGVPRRDTLMGVFQQGSTRIVGLLRQLASEGKETSPTTLVLPKPRHVWDVRHRRYCGYADRLRIDLDLYPKCYALLPANPTGMSMAVVPKTATQGQVITVTGSVGFGRGEAIDAVGQAVHIKVMAPGRREMECYRQNVVFKGARFEAKLPVSYSETPGRYTVIVEHVITGLKAQACFDVTVAGPEQTATAK